MRVSVTVSSRSILPPLPKSKSTIQGAAQIARSTSKLLTSSSRLNRALESLFASTGLSDL